MKVKIISDGTAHGTKLVDELDESIEMVTEITWHCSVDKPVAEVTLKMVGVPFEGIGETEPEVKEVIDLVRHDKCYCSTLPPGEQCLFCKPSQ